MEEELKKLGIELVKLAKKYDEEYLSLAYVDKSVIGNSNPQKQGYVDIYLDEEEVEERCLTEKTKNYKH